MKSTSRVEETSTERTGGVATGLEVAVHALVMKALFAHTTLQSGEGEIAIVDDGVADGAVLHSIKLLLHIAQPKSYPIKDGSILMKKNEPFK